METLVYDQLGATFETFDLLINKNNIMLFYCHGPQIFSTFPFRHIKYILLIIIIHFICGRLS